MASENDPKDPPADLFPFDEMSTGETSSLIRRAHQVTGKPDQPLTPKEQQRAAQPPLKPMTGAQLAFRPSAPPRTAGQQTGSFAALPPRPSTGTQPAYKPSAPAPGTGTNPAFKPGGTGSTPAFKPLSGSQPAHKPTTGTQPAHKPAAPAPAPAPEGEEAPVFDVERLQAQIRHLGITDSALGRAAQGNKVKPTKAPTSAAEDTFVKSKMKQAEAKVPDFSLDDDLG